MMIKQKLALFQIGVTFLVKALLKLDHHMGVVHAWVGDIQKLVATRGPVTVIAFIKELRLCYTRYLCGDPFSSKSPGLGIQLTSEGLPKGGILNELFRERDPPCIRLGLTLLGVSRILPGWKAPDLTPITSPPAQKYCPILGQELVGIVEELGWWLPRPEWDGCHVTTKAGPNAQALVGSIEDASLLTEQQISDLQLIGGDSLIQSIETSKLLSPLTWLSYFKLKPKGRNGKLALIKDKEAKTRIVALVDYWTQSALRPLHDAQMRFLRGLKPDMTFNQLGFRSTLARAPVFHSLDLTAATDRFPVLYQRLILSVLVGSGEWAQAWYRLICDRDYTISWGNRRDTVRYACGQPMGAYSSWATFAICHHVIVRAAAKRAGLPATFRDYVLLGDDIVIANDEVAKHYRKIMSELGVSFSETKTHVSKDTYEFAKRWIHRGTEVTGAPLGSLFEAFRFKTKKQLEELGKDFRPTQGIRAISYYEVVAWFKEVEQRWYPRTLLGSRGLFASIFHAFGREALSERLADKAWKVYLLPSREDSRLVRNMKFEKLGLMLIPGILSCFSWSRTVRVSTLAVLLNECKARVLQEALKKQLHALRRFQLESPKLVKALPEGVDAQSILPLLPPLAVLRRNIAELQLEFDKAHLVRSSDNMLQWLHLEVRLFLDPFATLSTRASKTMASAKVTILNHLTAMCRGVEMIRGLALGTISDEKLVDLIQNHEVLPTRGDKRRPRRPTPPKKGVKGSEGALGQGRLFQKTEYPNSG
uniref:RNA-dependent RNA polymerase n=1 Tax=Gigaspora rosea mitovirus 1 TaxID=2933357 RepID=A0A9Y0T6J0_9VIRU|nr:TPA_asm: RNA-dependent RNA polymerase [Gigaspora rosea mitovirus 1]